LQADTQTTVTMLCHAGLHVLDKKKQNKRRWQNIKRTLNNVKGVTKPRAKHWTKLSADNIVTCRLLVVVQLVACRAQFRVQSLSSLFQTHSLWDLRTQLPFSWRQTLLQLRQLLPPTRQLTFTS